MAQSVERVCGWDLQRLQSDKVPPTVGHNIQLHKVIYPLWKDGRWLTHQLQQDMSPIVQAGPRRKRRFKGLN